MGLWSRLFGKPPVAALAPRRDGGLFSTNAGLDEDPDTILKRRARVIAAMPALVRPTVIAEAGVGMDSNDGDDSIKAVNGLNSYWDTVPELQMAWYGKQTFIGYQLCGMIAQHWLVGKACSMPAKDAVRNGWEISSNDGEKLEPDVIGYIAKLDRIMKTKFNAIEYVRFGRIFGIRIMKFDVQSNDPNYYKNPFNIDAVLPGSYKGMSQIDPYWIVPLLTAENVNQPGNIHFYEPEFWQISGETIHRSHLSIYIPESVVDVLKPAYYYGGISIPQKIFERVYAAERTANEAPQLAMTKRLIVMKTDLTKAMADQQQFDTRMEWWTNAMNNYGVKLADTEDAIEQHDTALSDLDSLIMTQYQIVAAIAEVPGTKLLGTQPKGFNSTGEFEEASYHETLEGIQDNDLTPMLLRHYQLIVASYVQPKFGGDFEIEIKWNELDAMTALEQGQLNLVQAQTDAALEAVGAIDAQDIRNRIIADPDSGHNGLKEAIPPPPPEEDDAAGIKGTVPKAKPVPGA